MIKSPLEQTFGTVTQQTFERRVPRPILFMSGGKTGVDESLSSDVTPEVMQPVSRAENEFLRLVDEQLVMKVRAQVTPPPSEREIHSFALLFFQTAETIKQSELSKRDEQSADPFPVIASRVERWLASRQEEIPWARMLPYGQRVGSFAEEMFSLWKKFSLKSSE